MSEKERPRERVMDYGFSSLSNAELLALFIRTGYKGKSAIDIAEEILSEYSLKDLASLDVKNLSSIKGISLSKAIEVLASFELSKRLTRINCLNEDVTFDDTNLKEYLIQTIGGLKQENVLAIFLNKHNQIINTKTIFIGTIDSSFFHPREIFKEALKCSAFKIVIAHNHPGNSLIPSQKDLEMTDMLIDAGKTMGIEVVDHYIVTNKSVLSIKKTAYIE